MTLSYNELWGRVAKIFDSDGNLAKILPSFETRPGQKELAELVFQSFAQECIAIIEAGTGTGKTLAYLVPAVYFSLALGEPILVSTKTINLQEQIIYKDIPLLKETVEENFSYTLVKGWSNYLCMRKINALKTSEEFFDIDELKSYFKLKAWSEVTSSGDRSDIDFEIRESVWEKICAEPSACTSRRCQWYNRCFFFASRQKIKESNILVTNHALLFTHIANRRKSADRTSMVLPEVSRLILDEAHHIEEVASEHLGDEASSLQFYKMLDNLYSSRKAGRESGLLVRVRNCKFSPSRKNKIQNLLDSYCTPMVRSLREISGEFFYRISHLPGFEKDSDRVLITPQLKKNLEEIGGTFSEFTRIISDYRRQLANLGEQVLPENEELSIEIESFTLRMEEYRDSMIKILNASEEQWIYSLEYSRRPSNDSIRLKSYPLLVNQILYDELFKLLKTTTLTSATLSVGRSFSYLSNRLGLSKFDKDYVMTRIIESPFDFKKQAILAIPTDIPLAREDNFLPLITPHLVRVIKIMEGRTFILFTSFEMLKQCAEILKEKFQNTDYNILVQGEASRNLLLEKFKRMSYSVLLGTDSFWEGVDVPGRDLECVIIAKLPFRVPTDPIITARAEYLRKQGINPFYSYHIPQAVIRFKQGFGRLIRNTRDRGVIIILDRRILESNYGKTFLKSLPRCKTLKGSFAGTVKFIEDWQKEFNASLI